MKMKTGTRLSVVASLFASTALLSGCIGASPTYGTGKAADEQLLEDVTGILSIGPTSKQPIDYKPRGELVKPADKNVLPPAQESITASAGSGAWPESPEQRRARIRADATANQDNPTYDSPVEADSTGSNGITSTARYGERGNFEVQPDPEQQRAEFNRRLAETRQGSSGSRKYLSEPPLVYREASAGAPVGDVGEPEWKKEQRQKRAARKKGTGGLSDWLPW